MIMVYVLVAFDGGDFLEADMQQERIDGFIAIIERMLGAGKGSFDFVRQLFK